MDMIYPSDLTVRPSNSTRALLYCPSCDQRYTQRQAKAFINNGCWQVLCDHGCGLPLPYVLPSSSYALDAEQVRQKRWYHGTFRENWYQDILNTQDIPLVHLGTKRAAVARIRDMRSVRHALGGTDYLYTLRLDPESTIADKFCRDEPDMDVKYVGLEDTEHDVVRYVNLWESPGSISLIARPSCFSVVKREVVV